MQTCIQSYIKCLTEGKLIAFPTDTVWGLSVDATNTKAINSLAHIKKRPLNKSFSVLIPSVSSLEKYVVLSQWEKKLIQQIWPGSFSIVLKAKNLDWANQLGSLDGSVAFRCINNTFTNSLLIQWGGILVTTSANFNSLPVCTSAEAILQLNSSINICSYFMKFKEKLHSPSTVIKILEGRIKILRKAYQYDLLLSKATQNHWTVED